MEKASAEPKLKSVLRSALQMMRAWRARRRQCHELEEIKKENWRREQLNAMWNLRTENHHGERNGKIQEPQFR